MKKPKKLDFSFENTKNNTLKHQKMMKTHRETYKMVKILLKIPFNIIFNPLINKFF